jgi:hypothetical protein
MSSPDVIEFDLNPVFLYEKGVCIVDARIYVTDQGSISQSTPGRPLPPGILNIRSIAGGRITGPK